MAPRTGVPVRTAARPWLRRRAARARPAAPGIPHRAADVQSRSRRRAADRDRGGVTGGRAVHETRLVSPACGDTSLACDCRDWSLLDAGARARRHELLNPLAVGIGRVNGAFRIHDDAVDPIELAGPKPLRAPGRDDLAVFQRQLVDALAGVIGDERKAIIALARDADVPRIPAFDFDLAQVIEVLVVDLQAMALAIDDVHVFLRIDGELVRQHPLTG